MAASRWLRSPSSYSPYLVLLLLLFVPRIRHAESLTSNAATPPGKQQLTFNSRFVCLMADYAKVQGPYVHALLDQMLENECNIDQRRLAMCTTQKNARWCQEGRVSQLQDDFELDDCKLFVLDDYNPISLEQELKAFDPTIFWLVDDNAFRIRYSLRTSGLDGILNHKCGASSGSNCLFVGENAGALCSGTSLSSAHALQQDPKEAPEPQFFGLGLLGTDRSVSILNHSEQSTDDMDVNDSKTVADSADAISLEQDHLFVWSQPVQESATSFVFLPSQRGAIANLDSPRPLPPLVEDAVGSTLGGVHCTGEPAIDPSRMMEQVGDSEWINEAEDVCR